MMIFQFANSFSFLPEGNVPPWWGIYQCAVEAIWQHCGHRAWFLAVPILCTWINSKLSYIYNNPWYYIYKHILYICIYFADTLSRYFCLGFEVGCNFGELLLKRPLLPGKCEDAEALISGDSKGGWDGHLHHRMEQW